MTILLSKTVANVTKANYTVENCYHIVRIMMRLTKHVFHLILFYNLTLLVAHTFHFSINSSLSVITSHHTKLHIPILFQIFQSLKSSSNKTHTGT